MIKNIFRKFFTLILVLFLTAGIFIPENVEAADGSLSVAVSTSEIIVGNTFTVSVTLSYSKGISTSQFELAYDPNICSYVSGDADETSYAGVIPIIYMPSDYPTSATWNFTFKANQIGTCNFSTNGVVFIDPDINTFSPSLGSASVKVMAVGSDDATLSSINISGASLSPDFAKWTLDYTCYVGYYVTSVDISAVASQGGKTVINGDPYNLAVGGNAVSITSYAPNGKTMTYNINIVRSEPPTEPPATEPETETETETEPEVLSDTVITVDGKDYTLNVIFPEDEMPKGYVPETLKIDGNDVASASGSATGLNLVYFTDEDGNGSIFIYDKESKAYEKYITFTSGDNTYVYLDMSHSDSVIADTSEGECEIQGKKVKVYISDDDSDFVYFYAVDQKGERRWYCYDILEKTIQRKNIPETETVVDDDDSEKLSQELESLKDDFNKVSDENSSLIKGRNITFIAGGVVIVALIVVIVVMAAHKSEKKHAIDMPLDVEDDGFENDDFEEDNDEEAATEETAPETLMPEESGELVYEESEEPVSEQEKTEDILFEEEPECDLSDVANEPGVESEPDVAVEEIESEDVVVTESDKDAFEKEVEALAKELAARNEDITAQVEDGDEIEPEIIDISSDINKTQDIPDTDKIKESPQEENTEINPIELNPIDDDDEELFL